jgi:hypothetical protein
MRKTPEAVETVTPGGDCLTERERALVMAEFAADIRRAETECIRRGWLADYEGDGTLEITEAGQRHFFEWLASPEHTRH